MSTSARGISILVSVSVAILDFLQCIAGRISSATTDTLEHVTIHTSDGQELSTVLTLGVGKRYGFLWAFPRRRRSGGRVLTSVGRAFLRLEGIDHVFLLLASARTFRLKCLTVYIMMWLVDEGAFLAILDPRFRFSGPIAFGRMEETRKAAF